MQPLAARGQQEAENRRQAAHWDNPATTTTTTTTTVSQYRITGQHVPVVLRVSRPGQGASLPLASLHRDLQHCQTRTFAADPMPSMSSLTKMFSSLGLPHATVTTQHLLPALRCTSMCIFTRYGAQQRRSLRIIAGTRNPQCQILKSGVPLGALMDVSAQILQYPCEVRACAGLEGNWNQNRNRNRNRNRNPL
ncbi:hypothetical protein TREES_T100014791 [Tupaia chinensis]|uniref:Uncharacterized protein n=1 Tax=Tupaia chinensis TaxID=246437 RepID=L9KU54_TUPCH|nr:hypothetical protein TREES_T100014791 [Tupaia chinensis]